MYEIVCVQLEWTWGVDDIVRKSGMNYEMYNVYDIVCKSGMKWDVQCIWYCV